MLHGRAECRNRIRNSICRGVRCAVHQELHPLENAPLTPLTLSKFWPSTDGLAEHGDRILRSIPDPVQSSIWSSPVVAQSCKMDTIDTTKGRILPSAAQFRRKACQSCLR